MDESVTGTTDMELGASIVKRSTDAYRSVADMPYESMVTFYEELQPQNVLETMLVSQMANAHAHCIDLFQKAGSDMQLERLKMAQRLMKTFARCLETLEKTRRAGSQSFKVEHIHINQGAQAIIGSVENEAKRDHAK